MQYLLKIYDDETVWEKLSETERNAVYGEYTAYTNALQESGALLGANQLQPVGTATTVSIRDGEQLVTDGPFAETKEQLGGFYMIEARDLNDAIQVASRIPGAKTGSVEVRPVRVFADQ
jgi:hypothetical protein